jgi:hypothetical protein
MIPSTAKTPFPNLLSCEAPLASDAGSAIAHPNLSLSLFAKTQRTAKYDYWKSILSNGIF